MPPRERLGVKAAEPLGLIKPQTRYLEKHFEQVNRYARSLLRRTDVYRIGAALGIAVEHLVASRQTQSEGNNVAMNEQELEKRLALLKSEHRDLDAAIAALTDAGSTDQLQIARLKKRKLRLKDQIAIIEDTLLPDIIA